MLYILEREINFYLQSTYQRPCTEVLFCTIGLAFTSCVNSASTNVDWSPVLVHQNMWNSLQRTRPDLNWFQDPYHGAYILFGIEPTITRSI